MSDHNPSEAEPIGQIADEFVDAIRQGQPPSVEEFARRYPEHAEQIREMLPALVLMEKAKATTGPKGATVIEMSTPPGSPPGYELLDEIGRGGMGVVYRARDAALDRDVAVKLLSDRYPADSPATQRFLSEARISGQLQHPGIPAVHQVGTLADGRPFLAMKLIKGSTLEAILKQLWDGLEIRPTPRTDPAAERGRLLAIFEAVCQAVGYAHAHRVIHRDLKPANVMVGAFGEIQVMDWGLAKVLGEPTPPTAVAQAAAETQAWTEVSPTPEGGAHTQAGSLVGTPAFIAPEQAVGEIERVNERSDVFGLGAVLAVLLTGKPPYVGDTFESVRVKAVRGKLEDCFARLDASGAEPELVALCKRCLAFEPADRPADAGAVAAAVAGLRAAADERARWAELERVRVEGEQATARARSAERRKRRRLVIGAAAVLALAMVSGLTAVLAVQRQANVQLEAKNAALAEQQAEVEARFATAQRAIATFHTGVSEDFLLKNEQFKELRTKLLKEATGFYTELENLLADKTDVKSRKLLADGYVQLAELTVKIGDHREALAVQRNALALRRELATAPGADAETRLEVARSLGAVGSLLHNTGDTAGALSAFKEQRDLAAALKEGAPTDAVRTQMAQGHHSIGLVLWQTGNPAEALKEYKKAMGIQQVLADAHPVVTGFQSDLAQTHYHIGVVLHQTGKHDEALQELQKALAIRQTLADANPAVMGFLSYVADSHHTIGVVLIETGQPAPALQEFRKALDTKQRLAKANPAVTLFQRDLAVSHLGIGLVLHQMGKPAEGLQEYQQAVDIQEKLMVANPGVAEFQSQLAMSYNNIGFVLSDMGKRADALKEYQKARAIQQKLTDANPTVAEFQGELARSYNNIGWLHAREKRFAEAFADLDRGLVSRQKLADAHPTMTEYANDLGYSHAYRGWVHLRVGHAAEAVADLRRALEQWAKNKTPDAEDRFERARALALLVGLAADRKSGVTAAEAATFADQAVAALRDAFQAGWGKHDELKEPDFDAIRRLDDFKKLLAELEMGNKARVTNKEAESK
jgi:serine/threonine protein kinase/tetratricopeptide (TPR) repeat protein